MEVTQLNEQNDNFSDQNHIIETLLEDHEAIIHSLRNHINIIGNELKDAGTADFLTGIMELQEKMAWMLRSYL